MDIRPVKTPQDYQAALLRIDALMDAEQGSAAGDELDLLATLVQVYEQRELQIGPPDPIEFLVNAMDFLGYGQAELADLLGSRSRASEILNRRRPLSLRQIRRISSAWRLPADPLIGEYPLAAGQ